MPSEREQDDFKSDWIDRQFDLAVKRSLNREEVSLVREIWNESTYSQELELMAMWRRRDPNIFDRLDDLFAAHLMPLAEKACNIYDWNAHERAKREDEECDRRAA